MEGEGRRRGGDGRKGGRKEDGLMMEGEEGRKKGW